MESDNLSDVDGSDDLSRDANEESEHFEDAETFDDADIVKDENDLEDVITDMFLSQPDDATDLDVDIGSSDGIEKHQNSKSVLLSPQIAEPDEIQNPSDVCFDDAIEDLDEETISGRVDVQGQGNVSSDADHSVVIKYNDVHIISTLSVDQSEEVDDINEMQKTGASLSVYETKVEDIGSAVIPPPAPTIVIIGSMNPVDDDLESDDSQDEGADAEVERLSSLELNVSDDDDADVLEVDAAIVSCLQSEKMQRLAKQSVEPTGLILKSIKSTFDEEKAINEYFNSKADDTSTFELLFNEEIRIAAHVATMEPSSPFLDIHKMAGSSYTGKVSADETFGITYQGLKTISREPQAHNDVGYSMPSGPSFPDEREFENVEALRGDLVYSVATQKDESPFDLNDDDEFSFEANTSFDSSLLSETVTKARRDSLVAKQRKEEEEIVEELKRATDEEKRRNERSNNQPETARAMADGDTDTLSLTELHSIYKRGLGDQAILMNENDELNKVSQSASVLGRIFGHDKQIANTIEEEDDDDESEEEKVSGFEKNEINLAKVSAGNDQNSSINEKNSIDGSAEWREVKLVQHGHLKDAADSFASDCSKRPLLSYTEAATYYAETLDVMQHKDSITCEDFPPRSCFACFSRPRLTFDGSKEERDRVFCIAATGFNGRNEIVIGMLQTVYKKLTKTSRDVSLVGKHWEDIGFQGTDPSTDLRGCGVLSLLQMLYLVETFPDLSHRFHALSQHPTRHFPFACVLINITLQCVVALRKGALYLECNKHSSVLSGMNRLYVALASQLCDAVSFRVDELPHIMKDVLDRGRIDPSKVIDEAFDGKTLHLFRPAAPFKADSKEPDELIKFTEIGLQPPDEEK